MELLAGLPRTPACCCNCSISRRGRRRWRPSEPLISGNHLPGTYFVTPPVSPDPISSGIVRHALRELGVEPTKVHGIRPRTEEGRAPEVRAGRYEPPRKCFATRSSAASTTSRKGRLRVIRFPGAPEIHETGGLATDPATRLKVRAPARSPQSRFRVNAAAQVRSCFSRKCVELGPAGPAIVVSLRGSSTGARPPYSIAGQVHRPPVRGPRAWALSSRLPPNSPSGGFQCADPDTPDALGISGVVAARLGCNLKLGSRQGRRGRWLRGISLGTVPHIPFVTIAGEAFRCGSAEE